MLDKKKYHEYLLSAEWKLKRKEAFKIHGKHCRKCAAQKRLEVNHKHYRSIFNEDVLNDLEILCHFCHREYHRLKTKEAKRFRRARNKRKIKMGSPAMTMDEYRAHIAFNDKIRQKL